MTGATATRVKLPGEPFGVTDGSPAPEDGQWPPPVPLSARLPAFPVDLLPGVLGEFVQAVARSTQTPPDLAAYTGLATLSAATRGRWEIVVRPGWIEQTALYLAALSDSGSRKTAVVREVTRPLLDAEKAIRAERRHAYLEDAAAYRIREKRAQAAESAAAKPAATPDDEAAACALAAELGQRRRPTAFRALADDVTPEKLAMLMDDQDGPMAVLSAEGGLLGTLAGRYSDTANVDLVLKAYDCEPVRVDRITRDDLEIERPFLALGLIVQPDVIAEATKVRAFIERGLLPRFQFALPRTTVGTRALHSPDVPAAAVKAWDACVRAVLDAATEDVLDAATEEGPRRTIHLDADASTVLDELRAELEPRLHPELGDLARVAAWASKLPGALVRVAALFALADDAGTEWLRAEHMRAAVGLAPYLVAHACACLALDDQRRDARQVAVLAWVGRRASPQSPQSRGAGNSGDYGDAFTTRDAWQALRGQKWAETSTHVQAVLDELDEMGWLRRRPDPPRKGAGRPPSPVYDVNPAVHDLDRSTGP